MAEGVKKFGINFEKYSSIFEEELTKILNILGPRLSVMKNNLKTFAANELLRREYEYIGRKLLITMVFSMLQ